MKCHMCCMTHGFIGSRYKEVVVKGLKSEHGILKFGVVQSKMLGHHFSSFISMTLNLNSIVLFTILPYVMLFQRVATVS